MPEFNIAGRKVGTSSPVFIVAEVSANHRRKFSEAVKIVEAAAGAGADAVKVQTYMPDSITIDCDNEYFRIKQDTVWDGKTLYQLYKEAYMPWEWQPKLKKTAEELGLVFFSSPFDEKSVDFLEQLNVPVYKIASFEITDTGLIEYVATKNKPVIISTGIAELDEIEQAVSVCRSVDNNQIALLKCTSSYPASIDQMNLRVIPELGRRFGTVAGLSDHSLDLMVPAISVALGACIIEKHLTIKRSAGGPDATFSLEPDEFKQMVKNIRNAEVSLGKDVYQLTEKDEKSRKFARSLFVVKDIKAGEVFTKLNIRSIRPSDGISPCYLKGILGKKAKTDISGGTPLKWDMIC